MKPILTKEGDKSIRSNPSPLKAHIYQSKVTADKRGLYWSNPTPVKAHMRKSYRSNSSSVKEHKTKLYQSNLWYLNGHVLT